MALEEDADFLKFVAEALFVGGFQEPGTDCSVDLDGEADHLFG